MSSNRDFNRACFDLDCEEKVRLSDRGLASRNRAYERTLRLTRDPCQAVMSYCAGIKH